MNETFRVAMVLAERARKTENKELLYQRIKIKIDELSLNAHECVAGICLLAFERILRWLRQSELSRMLSGIQAPSRERFLDEARRVFVALLDVLPWRGEGELTGYEAEEAEIVLIRAQQDHAISCHARKIEDALKEELKAHPEATILLLMAIADRILEAMLRNGHCREHPRQVLGHMVAIIRKHMVLLPPPLLIVARDPGL